MALLLCAISLSISIHDIRFHLITNKSLLLLSAISLALFAPATLYPSLVALALLILMALVTDIGGGDIKLIAILVLTQGHIWLTAESALIAMVIGAVLLLVLRLRIGIWPLSIPLAPVILAPIAYFYLAI
jgi:Flp pilus assembly protein protease CpaA